MRIAMLSPPPWRTLPRHDDPRKHVVSLLTEGLVERGIDVTLFDTAECPAPPGLHAVSSTSCEEAPEMDTEVCEILQMSELFEHAHEFDLVHNHGSFLPLTYSGLTDTPLVTTVHGLPSPRVLPAFRKYNNSSFYVAVSEFTRSAELDYVGTVYYGIDLRDFIFNESGEEHLVFFNGIHPETGATEAIEIATRCGMDLVIAGEVGDGRYFQEEVEPLVDGHRIRYIGNVGSDRRSQVLGAARALLHPVKFQEPFAWPAVQSNACGTPVIAFNTGSIPELIADGVNGFLVTNVTEAVEAVGKIRAVSRRGCREFVERNFSRDRMVEEYIKVYEQILGVTKREDHRPWGYYSVLLDRPDHKVKHIVVYPGKRLSLQQHKHRSEHWTVISGSAEVTVNENVVSLSAGQSIAIPVGTKHRVYNPGKEWLVFIEVQTGSYFGENDIERFEDDFGRI